LDDTIPGTITYEQGIRGAAPEIVATSSALLLWLYERLDLCGPSLTREVVSAAEVATRATVWASANLPKFGMLTEKVHHHAPNRSRTNGNLSPRSKYVSTSTNSCQLFGVLELDDQVDVDGGSVSMPAPHARSREGPLMSV
jgi:hypothetical protein